MNNTTRHEFREQVFDRDNHRCIIPWCDAPADDAHHIIERDLWAAGGYIPKNGVSVCNKHHQYAESDDIPPAAFWQWASISNPVLPESLMTQHVDKWGDEFETPPWTDLRKYSKYPSTRHLLPLYWHDPDTTADSRLEHDDTGLESLEDFVGKPLVITEKMDGGNMMVTADVDTPVRARNGSEPENTMREMYRPGGLYWTHAVNEKLPDTVQVFGEWLRAKHSIHYGCDCDSECEDSAPPLTSYTPEYDDSSALFQIFGVFDTERCLWLSWPETEQVADALGFPTTPVRYVEADSDTATFETVHEARTELLDHAHNVVKNGGEGIVVRTKFPFHYGQFGTRVGKYVRENHVSDTERHWSHRTMIENRL